MLSHARPTSSYLSSRSLSSIIIIIIIFTRYLRYLRESHASSYFVDGFAGQPCLMSLVMILQGSDLFGSVTWSCDREDDTTPLIYINIHWSGMLAAWKQWFIAHYLQLVAESRKHVLMRISGTWSRPLHSHNYVNTLKSRECRLRRQVKRRT